ncbi:MAG: hypothetical protein CMJ93_08635 [Planctomycetes bacterium]|nr:hypothetical protein [Planctomycetota bacterium]
MYPVQEIDENTTFIRFVLLPIHGDARDIEIFDVSSDALPPNVVQAIVASVRASGRSLYDAINGSAALHVDSSLQPMAHRYEVYLKNKLDTDDEISSVSTDELVANRSSILRATLSTLLHGPDPEVSRLHLRVPVVPDITVRCDVQ